MSGYALKRREVISVVTLTLLASAASSIRLHDATKLSSTSTFSGRSATADGTGAADDAAPAVETEALDALLAADVIEAMSTVGEDAGSSSSYTARHAASSSCSFVRKAVYLVRVAFISVFFGFGRSCRSSVALCHAPASVTFLCHSAKAALCWKGDRRGCVATA
jgi:hypothetical protein